MSNSLILVSSWPHDLDPAAVPFKARTATVLRRQGLFENWKAFDQLTVDTALSWWNAGPVTVEDLRTAGNEAITRHHDESALLRSLEADLSVVAVEPWARHVWYHDPRFAEFVPKGHATVYDIATSGAALDRRSLWERLDALQAAVDAQAALSLPVAVSVYVESISGQHGDRLVTLLARTALNGRDPITGIEAGRRLGVSFQRISQLEMQLRMSRDRAGSPGGIWMPQVVDAELDGWPDDFTDTGIEAVRSFFA